MNAQARRQAILAALEQAESPISAGSFAAKFGVSRQVIVGDIALLRANGALISALAKGYLLEKSASLHTRVFKMQHSDEDAKQELNLIVDAGAVVLDVFIYHKVHGTIRASMNLRSRRDVDAYLGSIASGKSSFLKNVTSGYHYHTVGAESPIILDFIEGKLREKGFLAPLQEYEPHEIQKYPDKTDDQGEATS